jgi:hypothetical protein
LDSQRDNGIHSDDLGKKDFKENLWTTMWRIRSNLEELQNAYKSPDTANEIQIRILEWLGHVIRMEDTHIPKMILNTKLGGRPGVR